MKIESHNIVSDRGLDRIDIDRSRVFFKDLIDNMYLYLIYLDRIDFLIEDIKNRNILTI